MNVNSYSCCSQSSKEAKQVDTISSLLKVVSEESRLKIICILRGGEHCVCEIEENVTLSQSLISHHLKDLKEADIVKDEKRGLYVYYKLSDKGKKVTDLLFQL